MNTRWHWSYVVILVSLCVDGCGAPPPDPPTAVIQANPETICLGDNHQTQITLNAHESAPRLALVPLPSEDDDVLLYDWTMSGAAYEVIEGTLTGPELVVTTVGDRPLHVRLTVTNSEGGEARSLKSINVVPLENGVCPLDEE